MRTHRYHKPTWLAQCKGGKWEGIGITKRWSESHPAGLKRRKRIGAKSLGLPFAAFAHPQIDQVNKDNFPNYIVKIEREKRPLERAIII